MILINILAVFLCRNGEADSKIYVMRGPEKLR